jgi:peptidoglycan/LPS O-acetylase OafA/YrhL
VFLDGIRALAAIAVLVHHGYQTVTSEGSLRGSLSLLRHGNFAVAVFIVLSGFSLAVAASRRSQRQGFGAFIRRRAWRVIPAYLAALVLSLLLIGTLIGTPTGTPWDLALPLSWTGVGVNAFLLQDVLQVRAPNHVFWSIAVEWHLYFLFPLLVACGRRFPRWCLLVVGALGCALLWPAYGGQPYIGFPPQFFALFVVGVLAGDIASDRGSDSPRWRRRCRPQWTAIGLVLAMPLAVLLVRVDPTYFTSEIILGCAVAAFLITLTRGSIDYPARRALEWRPLAWVGLFSYSLYLTHAPVLQIVWQYGVRPIQLGPNAELAVTIVAATAGSLAFAFGFHLLFERPFLNHRSVRALAGAMRRRASALPRLQPALPSPSLATADAGAPGGKWSRTAVVSNRFCLAAPGSIAGLGVTRITRRHRAAETTAPSQLTEHAHGIARHS